MVWCGLGDNAAHARSLVAPVMEQLYKTPFDRFERYTPCGTPAEVAEAIAPFVELGFHDILLNGVAEDATTLIALSDEVGVRWPPADRVRPMLAFGNFAVATFFNVEPTEGSLVLF